MSDIIGFIEKFDLYTGIEGWAVDPESPEESVTLELVVGEVVIAESRSQFRRDDVAAELGFRCTAGFRFDGEDIQNLTRVPTPLHRHYVAVRVQGTEALLSSLVELPTVVSIIQDLKRRDLSTAAEAALQSELRLQDVKASSQSMLARSFRAFDENRQGFIEQAAVDQSGNIWAIGWMQRGHPFEFPAVIVDGQKFAAGVVTVSFNREDLPDTAVGIIAVIATDWRPSAHSEATLYFGTSPMFHLSALKPLPVVRMENIVGMFEQIKPRCTGLPVRYISRLLTSRNSWAISDLSKLGFPLDLYVDAMLVLPNFGCFAQGWILSPVKDVAKLRIKMGTVVLVGDEESLITKARPDLLSVSPGNVYGCERAGFVATFRGEVTSDELHDALLQVEFRDGTAATIALNPKLIRVVNTSADVESVRAFYPAIQYESYFSEFAKALRALEKTACGRVTSFQTSASDTVLVLTLPSERPDILLNLELLTERLDSLPDNLGLAIIAPRNQCRDQITQRVAKMSSLRPGRISLYFVDDTAYAFYALEKILAGLGASRFAFVGAGVHLGPAGWNLLTDRLDQSGDRLEFFHVSGSMDPAAIDYDNPSAVSFLWNYFDFSEYLFKTPGYVGGIHRDNGLTAYVGYIPTIHSLPAIRYRPHLSSPFVDAINDVAL